jgi:hypothetical protein
MEKPASVNRRALILLTIKSLGTKIAFIKTLNVSATLFVLSNRFLSFIRRHHD